jgi:hypothetical protein
MTEAAPHMPDESERADPDATGPGLPPPSAIESLVNALLEAGPEAAEHVVRAAQELLLAAQCVIDAAEQAVREQQGIRRTASPESASRTASATRHLDLAE